MSGKTGMVRIPWIKEDIVEAYRMFRQGETTKTISNRFNRSRASVNGLIWRVNKLLETNKMARHYPVRQAMKEIRNNQTYKAIPSVTVENYPINGKVFEARDNLVVLEQAFNDFQKTIVEVIDAEVTKRVGAKQEELQKLRLEVENYRQTFEKLKNSNWVEGLRKKWASG